MLLYHSIKLPKRSLNMPILHDPKTSIKYRFDEEFQQKGLALHNEAQGTEGPPLGGQGVGGSTVMTRRQFHVDHVPPSKTPLRSFLQVSAPRQTT